MNRPLLILFFVLVMVSTFTKRHKIIVQNNGHSYETTIVTLRIPQFLVPSELGIGTIESELPEVGKIATLKSLHCKNSIAFFLCDTYHPTIKNGDYVTGIIANVD